MPSDAELSKAVDILKSLGDSAQVMSECCKLSSDQRAEYNRLLLEFKNTNGNIHATTEAKGKSLEELVRYTLSVSGNIFRVHKNIRTTSNEIDVIVTLTSTGATLVNNGLLTPPIKEFVGECKNYGSTVDVTFVGKFCSLMLTTNNHYGIMFSYHGVSGKGWSYASGLIRKFYLHREREDDRYVIFDFSFDDFNMIAQGSNLFAILQAKLQALKYDTSYIQFLSKHPAQDNYQS